LPFIACFLQEWPLVSNWFSLASLVSVIEVVLWASAQVILAGVSWVGKWVACVIVMVRIGVCPDVRFNVVPRMNKTFSERWLRKEKKMLKKSLIAIAVLAIVALPAFGATVKTDKYHKPWDSHVVYEWDDLQQIKVVLDVGYWIKIEYNGDIEVHQDSNVGPAFSSYAGCMSGVKVWTNFNATLKADVTAESPAGGKWSGTLNSVSKLDIAPGETSIEVCVTATEVKIENLTAANAQGGSDNVHVATVHIMVVPTEFKNQA